MRRLSGLRSRPVYAGSLREPLANYTIADSTTRNRTAWFRDFLKERLDRRYSLTTHVVDLQRAITDLDERFARADQFMLLRNEVDALSTRPLSTRPNPPIPCTHGA